MRFSLLFVLFSILIYILSMSMIMEDCLVMGDDSDRLALLDFKAKITQDPLGTLSSWNDSLHFCEWRGVTCSRRHRTRVTRLYLPSQSLVGSISPHIGNLSFLKVLNLTKNSFNGEIPQQVGRLFRLQRLYLGENLLEEKIPVNLSHCFNLTILRLYKNKLVGRIPDELGELTQLRILDLYMNNLSGEIPLSVGNLTSLIYLYLDMNSFHGSIPSTLSQLTSLTDLILESNNLSGMVPLSLYNLSSLEYIGLSNNTLQGTFPSNIGLTLPNLVVFSAFQNKFSGSIPSSFSNCSRLETLQLSMNNLFGSVPNELGESKSLKILIMFTNNLGSGRADDLNFLSSLINCTSLNYLSFSDNSLGGMLPNSVANLSTKLTSLNFGSNLIYGSIPTGIQNLVGLTILGFEVNLLTGNIPTGIGKLQNLGELYLFGNNLSGQIPSSFGNLTQLLKLGLSNNSLTGPIPSTIGNCKSLQYLDLYGNKLSGFIPKQAISLSSLSLLLNLGKNSLTGPLPLEVGKLKNLGVLVLSENRLSGEIPSTLGECSSLEVLQMDGNFFQGKIPPTLSSMKGLQDLNLARNNLSGRIPKNLENLELLSLNLSYNNLEGEVPRDGVFKNLSAISVDGNSKLCGGVPELKLSDCSIQLKPKKQRKSLSLTVIIIIIAVTVLCSATIAFFLTLYWRKKSKTKFPSTTSDIGNQYLGVSYNELLKATDGFGSTNLLGVGSFGSVYRGVLHDQDEKLVAVKVLNLQQKGATKSFMAECDALRKVRHRNLLKIITCCSSTDFQGNDFKALVFEFMCNGSLENWLHSISTVDDQSQWRNLSLEQRLNIAVDVASALDYLHHHHCQTPIVHRGVKPSNVLLDDDLTAHVGDFGLAKFLSKPSSSSVQNDEISSSIAIKGSIGYVAPEYGMGGEVSTQGDVYSYGILLLEMFTGKRPTDDIFKDGLSLHNFSKMALPLRVMEIVDSRLLLEFEGDGNNEIINHNADNRRRLLKRNQMQEVLASVIGIGVVCSSEFPTDRISMDKVILNLQVVKDLFKMVGM